MIMSYERHRRSSHATEIHRYGQQRNNKMWERTNNIYYLFYYSENNVWEGDHLIRPLLITVIGHYASQECNWPIAVNPQSLFVLLSPQLLIYWWTQFPFSSWEEFSLVLNKGLIISDCLFMQGGLVLKRTLNWYLLQAHTFCFAVSTTKYLTGYILLAEQRHV